MMNNNLQLFIEDPYVKKVLSTLYMPSMCNITAASDQIKAINVLINVFGAFEYFEQNKQPLLTVKTMWENFARRNGFDQSAFELSVALNMIINSYEKKDSHFDEFQKALPLVIELLKARKIQRLKSDDTKIQSNKLQSNFFAEPKSNRDDKPSTHENTGVVTLSQ